MNDGNFGNFAVFGILYLIMFALFFFAGIERNKDQQELYAPKENRKRKEHKARMKYLTSLSCDETILRLTRMYMPFDGTFGKENDNEKDQMYVLEITEVPRNYRGLFQGSVKYKVMVTPAQEGSAVWLFLSALDREWLPNVDFFSVTRLSDDEMLNMFAWEVEKLFEKLLEAVRVE